jgi:hypothetical protein
VNSAVVEAVLFNYNILFGDTWLQVNGDIWFVTMCNMLVWRWFFFSIQASYTWLQVNTLYLHAEHYAWLQANTQTRSNSQDSKTRTLNSKTQTLNSKTRTINSKTRTLTNSQDSKARLARPCLASMCPPAWQRAFERLDPRQ